MKRISSILVLVFLAAGLWLGVRALRSPKPEALLGLWMEREVRYPTDELRFYYFHKGGKGLYRYGQVGHSNTHSFDWRLEGDKLVLLFRKTGENARTAFSIVEENGGRTLVLRDDPRNTPQTRYRYRPAQLEVTGPLMLPSEPVASSDGDATAVVGRMWIDLRRYATGGMGYSMYQLSEHDAGAGWHVGWHHRGDFDEWSTELLLYRLEPAALRLRFVLGQTEAVTPFSLGQRRDQRTLRIERDPRNFVAPTTLVDAGRSF